MIGHEAVGKDCEQVLTAGAQKLRVDRFNRRCVREYLAAVIGAEPQ
jgi:hypothetical protein